MGGVVNSTLPIISTTILKLITMYAFFFKSSRKCEAKVLVSIFTKDPIKAYILAKGYFRRHNIKGKPVLVV